MCLFVAVTDLKVVETIIEHYLPGVEDHHEALGRRADGDGAVVLGVQVVGQRLRVAAAGPIPPPHNLMEHW